MLHICHSRAGGNDNRRLLLSIFIYSFVIKSDEYWLNKAFQNSQLIDSSELSPLCIFNLKMLDKIQVFSTTANL